MLQQEGKPKRGEEKSRRLDERGGGVGHGKSIQLSFLSFCFSMYVKNNNNFVSQHILGYLHFSGRAQYHLTPQYNFQPSTSHNFSIIMVFSHIHSLYKSSGVRATVYVESKTNMQAPSTIGESSERFSHTLFYIFREKLILKVFNIGYL